jgi:CBS domain-containing protein
LSHGLIEITNTYHRFKKLAELEPQYAELYEDCAEAFNTLMRFRTEEGLTNNSNGKYLDLNLLSKSDKLKLKNCFQPISDVQDIIKNRFPITYLN